MDPLAGSAAGAATKGAAGAATKWSLERIGDLVTRFRNREVSFIEDPRTIERVKDSRKSAEFLRFRKYSRDAQNQLLMRLGLVLRQYENEKATVEAHRTRIRKRHGLAGLHLAEAMQSGILSLVYERLEQTGLRQAEIDSMMERVVENIDHFVAFVHGEASPEKEAMIIAAQVRRSYPRVFVVAGSGTAKGLTAEIAREMSGLVPGYVVERVEDARKVAFVFSDRA